MIRRAIHSLSELVTDLYAGIVLIPVILSHERGESFIFRDAADWLIDRVAALETDEDEDTQEIIDAACQERERRTIRASLIAR